MVGRFGSVEQFWSYYCHLVRPCELTGHSDFHLFKDGIKPMWEVSKIYTVTQILTYSEHDNILKLILLGRR